VEATSVLREVNVRLFVIILMNVSKRQDERTMERRQKTFKWCCRVHNTSITFANLCSTPSTSLDGHHRDLSLQTSRNIEWWKPFWPTREWRTSE
jgi:hypothetical protein